MTPRTPLPRAALAAIREAQAAQDEAATLIRSALRGLPRDSGVRPDLVQALEELLRARRLLDEARRSAR